MARFQFRLERVRQWQASVCAAEEDKLRDLLSALATLDQSLMELCSQFNAAKEQWRDVSVMNTTDLRAWSAFCHANGRKERSLMVARRDTSRAVEAQREALIRARKRLESIDKLRDRALHVHQVGVDRELEEVALTAHLHTANERRRDISLSNS
jgi:hypothetical protein